MVRAENPNLDVTGLRGLSRPDVAALTKGIYLDSAHELVLRGTSKFYDSRDKPIFEHLAKRVDNLETPVLVRGLKVEHFTGDNKGYGLRVVPTDEFEFFHDTRLSQAGIFNSCDESGMPIFVDNGKSRWHVSDFAISGLYRVVADLLASRDLACSDRGGRVALVSRA